jgi:hypothetical protein
MRFSVAMWLAAVLSVSACAGPGASVPPETRPMAPLPEVTGATDGLVAVPWTLDRLEPGGTAGTVQIANGACHDLEGVRTRVDETAIELTVLGTSQPACTSSVASIVAISLPEPLGSRTLRPGTTG